jgi:SAM-dependent methyltransferase
MSVFNEYARYYDLLYRDKDYAGEAEYVHGLIQSQLPGAKSILNLGCGSGRHDRCLAELGYEIIGVDLSEEMLSTAKEAARGINALEYFQGDARTIQLDRQFDVVISLFHVMSYQVTNADLKASFATATVHLRPGGLFIFDCWYGPGVLSDRPTIRVKELEDDIIKVIRIAEPLLHPNENVVDVNYRILIRDKSNSSIREIRETHRMRYFFMPEVDYFLNQAGMKPVFAYCWQTTKPTDWDTWYLCCGAINDSTGKVGR